MRWRLLITITLLSLSLNSCKKEGSGGGNANEIVLGEYASMTGGTATFGQSSHKGLILAIEQSNNAGGVIGKKIKLITEDDQSNQDQANAAVQKLISRDKVVAILGEVASSRSLAGGSVCQKFKIPMLSPASTNNTVTEIGDHVFRICFTDDFQGAVCGRFAAKRGWKKIAMLTDARQDYSKGLAKSFRDAYGRSGTIIMEESYRTDDRDFKAQLTKIKGASPDAVFVPGYYGEAILIVRQAREIGLNVPLFGGDGWDSPETLKLGSIGNGCYYTDHFHREDPRPEVKKFIDDFHAKYNEDPDAMAVLGYDAGNVMLDAIKRAGKADSSAIRDALAATKDFPGVTGKITIDEKRNARKPIVILELRDGATHLAETIAP
ncbi:MAG TPA: ABC transporter substrate-binding protein [Tepidisphaeraceae bacterium]|jgi:branched-chain amino acid transport system substrate-binding protein|nr:ABC transporter substrate-binding protein [Tepidisphaeraceae bacterium]